MHGVDFDAREAAGLQKGGSFNHLADFLLDLFLGEGRGGFGGVMVIGDFRGAVTAHGVASIAHGDLGEHLGAIGVQTLQ